MPFDCGVRGAEKLCIIPLALQNSPNCTSLSNSLPWSILIDTIGHPNWFCIFLLNISNCSKASVLVLRNVGIKRLHDDLRVTAAQLMLLVLKVNAASTKVTTAQRLRVSTVRERIKTEEKIKIVWRSRLLTMPKLLMEAVEKRFDGNVATKKTQRNLLKQQYENFTAPSLEMLD
ncbi:hypothetical protein Tco_1078216 [Tanacetum coccineum]